MKQEEIEAQIRAEEEAIRQAENEAKLKADEEATKQAEIEGLQNGEDANIRQAEIEAQQNAEDQEKIKAKEEVLKQAELEATQKELEAQDKAEEEAKLKVKEEVMEQAEIEARNQAEVEEEAKLKAEEEAKEQSEIDAKHQAEFEAKQKVEEETKLKADDEAKEQAEFEATKQAELEAKQRADEEAKIKAEEEPMTHVELEAAEEETKKRDEIAAQQEADSEHSLNIDDQSVNLEISETLTNGTFNDEQSDKIKTSNVNMDTFVEELYSLVDQPIANDDDVESASNIIENGHDNNNREEEPKKVETKNVDIDEFLGELDSLVDVEPPELVLKPVLMTELQIKLVSEISSETLTNNNTTSDQAFITTNGTFNDELLSEKVIKNSDSVTEPAELGAEPFLEVPPVTIDELVLVNPSESLKLSEPAEQDVVDCSTSSNENFRNVQGNFPTVSSSSSSNGLENAATKIKDDQFSIDTSSTMKKKRSQKIKYYPYHPKLVGTILQPTKIGQQENNTNAKKTTSTCTIL